MSLSIEEIREILAAVEESGWDSAQITVGDVTLSLSRSGAIADAAPSPVSASAPPTPAPAETPPAATEAAPVVESDGLELVRAPSIGTFWRSPQPGAPPFTEVGARVETDDVLCIVEVMKLMNHVVAGVAGEVTAIHTTNGQMVEHGAPLFTVRTSTGS